MWLTWVAFFFTLASPTFAGIKELWWNLTYVDNANPDGLYERRVIGVNGTWPCVSTTVVTPVEIGNIYFEVLDRHPLMYQPMTHSSYMRSTVSFNHRPFTTMACFSMAQPGSTVPKAYRNGKHNSHIPRRTSYLCLLVEFRLASHSTTLSP
jgi:hypothetical protein